MKHTATATPTLEIAGYEEMLKDRRNAILTALGAKVDGLSRHDRVSDEDQAQASHEEFVSLRLNGMEYRQLREIQTAIEKLRSGDYGHCENCEEPIPAKRLRAIPWAKFCVPCQERHGDRQILDRDPVFLRHEPAQEQAAF